MEIVKNDGTIGQSTIKDSIKRLIIIILIIAALIIIAAFIFNRFKLYSNARIALREAKNIKLSLEMADVEYYNLGMCIYDEDADGNIRKSVVDYVNRIQGNPEGFMRLTAYDSKTKKILGFEYELEDYIVRFTHKDDNDKWQVFKAEEILSYE